MDKRFVEKKSLWLSDDRTTDGDALPLPAGQLFGQPFKKLLQSQDLGDGVNLLVDLGLADPGRLQGEADILGHIHVRIQSVGLEHHGKPPLGRQSVGDILVIDQQRSVRSVLETCEDSQKRGLAASRRADEDNELTLRDVEIDTLDNLNVVKPLFDRQQPD